MLQPPLGPQRLGEPSGRQRRQHGSRCVLTGIEGVRQLLPRGTTVLAFSSADRQLMRHSIRFRPLHVPVCQARIDYYERGTYWGKPASGILYSLAHAMHLDDNRLLWYAIPTG